jgi:hypothetical protein
MNEQTEEAVETVDEARASSPDEAANLRLVPRPVMRFERIPVDRVIVTKRQREVDQEHVGRLVESFEQFGGQLQPIIVTGDMVLIDGRHRLEAAMQLGWEQIDAGIASHVESEEDRAFLEAEANAARREMTLSERKVLWETIFKPRLTDQAARAQKAGKRLVPAGKFPAGTSTRVGDTRDLAQHYVQLSVDTMQKVEQLQGWKDDDTLAEPIRKAAADGLARADVIGKVDGEFRRVETMVTAWKMPPQVLQLKAAEGLVSRVIASVTKASQDLHRIDPDALTAALKEDATAAGDWAGVLSAAAFILEFVEDAAVDAEIRVGTR